MGNLQASLPGLGDQKVKSGVSATEMTLPSRPMWFSESLFKGTSKYSGTDFPDGWLSLALPNAWYGMLPSGQTLWGVIPDRLQVNPKNNLEGELTLASSESPWGPALTYSNLLASMLLPWDMCLPR